MWLFYLGLCILANFLYDCLKSPVQMLHHKWLQYHNKVPLLCERYGKWAAVTGSTDGIGKAYAKELARLGLNIVLISRSETKLQQVAKEIENEFGVQTMIVQTDFSQGPKVYEHLYRELAKKPIGILVNNVGIGHNPPGTLTSFAPDHLWHIINVNIAAATLLSRHFVDKWLHNNIKGCIINISSGLELQPVPYGSVYGATKAYLRSFTLALQHEVKNYGIAVQLVSPAFVRTNINTYSAVIMKGNIFIPRPEQYAKWAVSTIGVVSETTGYFWHGLQTTVWKLMPVRFLSLLIIFMSKCLVDDLSNFHPSEGALK